MRNTITALATAVLAFVTPSLLVADEPTHGEPLTEPVAPALVAIVDDYKTIFRDASGGMAISGFFDVNATSHRSSFENVTFGSFELGVARPVGTRAELVGAVVMNDDGAALTAALLDVRLSPVAKNDDSDVLRLQIGRFDVPFGNDWQSYASKDRVEISAPLTTTILLGGGFNATGVNLSGKTRIADYSAFALRHDAQMLSGGRFGLSARGIRAGVSFMRLNGMSEGDGQLTGVDAEARIGPLRARAERVERELPDRDTRVAGWHATLDATTRIATHVTLAPFLRYDTISAGGPNAFAPIASPDRARRFTAGVTTTVAQLFTFKLEHQRNMSREPDATQETRSGYEWLAQIVIAF